MVNKRLCEVTGCKLPHKASGLCGKHYEYAGRGATLEAGLTKKRVEKYEHKLRNLDKVNLTATCLKCGPVDVNYKLSNDSYGCKPAQALARADYALRRKYGISLEQKAEMWEAQGRTCAVCSRALPLDKVHVDHCHDRMKVRGLLCGPCNRGLGMFYDNPEILSAAITYLLQH